mmetsp:Transcript_27313/g.38637  ORF Transcript_27313/g.38637 Transcript_27313/m.38637 type:complete len:477 (-) Transcript_27313:47-1477(-)|eukprot:CAMPEP_0175097294 /NCGR_PEP_ID=MMETSP0086_2-20121207/5205_1 /TAXON_ID=136419 /ORGANISM="Unknown Unknown, Strain D1" /LENGTH=476 /DNA_ID=CAMNT_0016370785 /DNA_START=27 /DNA_END=1457 /DNA_ORIENTATION=+
MIAAVGLLPLLVNGDPGKTAFVHLFEWKWNDVAQECEEFLGPMGFGAVQTSPQMEHIQGSQWWTRYQPVSYQTISRSGTEDEFRKMVSRCKQVGVDVIADPVPNHMAGGSGTGVGGSTYGARSYPNAGPSGYSPDDFHHNQNDVQHNCQVSNYNDKNNVQLCDLVGLPDINTGANYPQTQLANYLNNLTAMGVAGFRVDAAKHQDATHVGQYLQMAGSPWVFQEVIWGANEAVQPEMYTGNGRVTEFRWANQVGGAFKNYDLSGLGNIPNNYLSSSQAVNFLDNHDTQRGGAPITYKDGDKYRIANYFMLAHPYGYPKVMSSYYFNDHDQGPPSTPVHSSGNVACFMGQPWVCEHRWIGVGEMVGFRNTVGNENIANWHTESKGQLSFSRGDKGFVAFNVDSSAWESTVPTGMNPGTYCDVTQGLNPCVKVLVNQDGTIKLDLKPTSALAIHANARPSGAKERFNSTFEAGDTEVA